MVTKGYGLTLHDIDWSCPAELEPYALAHEKEMVEQDYLQHLWWGKYGVSAVWIAIEHCFAGKKAMSKFVEKPILSRFFENEGVTEEEEYEKKVRKTLLAEEQWIMAAKRNGMQETKI